MQGLVDGRTDDRGALQGAPAPLQESLVTLRGPQGREMVRKAADGR